MGKTPLPLTILVAGEWLAHEAIEALRAKGHLIGTAPDADLILAPHAHYWDATMWTRPAWLEIALKRARQKRKEAA